MILAADLGGTRARLGLFKKKGPFKVRELRVYSSRDFSGPTALFKTYLKETRARPEMLVLAVAGPVLGATVHLTNLGWTVVSTRLAAALEIPHVAVLNDLQAVGYALGILSRKDFEVWRPGKPQGQVAAVLAPGTGLGECLVKGVKSWGTVLPTEGGHVEFPADTEEEWRLYQHLKARYGHVSVERVASGSGLTTVYHWLSGKELPAEEIVSRARTGEPQAERAVRLVARALGREAGNLILKGLALQGLYLTGGLAPALRPWFEEEFLPALEAKGRLESLLKKVPVKLIVHPYPGLLGAARWGRLLLSGLRAFLPKDIEEIP